VGDLGSVEHEDPIDQVSWKLIELRRTLLQSDREMTAIISDLRNQGADTTRLETLLTVKVTEQIREIRALIPGLTPPGDL
jgi:hypothetical protein